MAVKEAEFAVHILNSRSLCGLVLAGLPVKNAQWMG